MTRINIFISANNSKNNSIRFFLPFQQWEKEERERKNEHSIIQTLVQNSLYCKTHISDECGHRKSKSYLKICIDFLLLNPLQFPTREFNNPSDKSNSIHNPLILFSLFSFFFRHPKNTIKTSKRSILLWDGGGLIGGGCRRWFYFRITHTGRREGMLDAG